MSCVQQVELQIFFPNFLTWGPISFWKGRTHRSPRGLSVALDKAFHPSFSSQGVGMPTCHDVCLLGYVFIVGLFFFLCLPMVPLKYVEKETIIHKEI